MADRDAHLTDPAFRNVPVGRLTDPAYAATLAARIDLGSFLSLGEGEAGRSGPHPPSFLDSGI